MTPTQISDVLREVFHVNISWQKLQAVLNQERTVVARRRSNGRYAYQIMQAGDDRLTAATPQVVYVDPTKALTSIRTAENLLGTLTGAVRICDPYADTRTIDFLTSCLSATSLQLLSDNIRDRPKFERDLRAFNKQHPFTLTVRQAPKGVLHDRYVIHDAGMLLFGTSLNGFGFKQSFVVVLGEDFRNTITPVFDALWAAATVV